MNALAQFAGRLHPLVVHLPIGILLLALLFEVLSRKESHRAMRAALPFVLLTGAIAAMFSCLSGWLLSRNGEYEPGTLNRHQWSGIALAIVSLSAYWLKIRERGAAYFFASALLLPGILLTGHWGITLTHGEGYLTKNEEATVLENEDLLKNQEVPDAEVASPKLEHIEALQTAGVVVLPIGQNTPFLSLNFVNAPAPTPLIRRAMKPLAENIAWLKLSGTALNDSTLALISTFKNLTKLHLDHTVADDASLVFLQKMESLVYLNLVGTKITARGVATLGELPHLQKLFLYQSGVKPEDLPALRAKMPRVRIDTGGYQVPILPTDTTVLQVKK